MEASLRKLQANTATKQRINRKRPPPPPLPLYLELVLEAADVDRLGRLSSEKFMATMGGMGLGLQKADLNGKSKGRRRGGDVAMVFNFNS